MRFGQFSRVRRQLPRVLLLVAKLNVAVAQELTACPHLAGRVGKLQAHAAPLDVRVLAAAVQEHTAARSHQAQTGLAVKLLFHVVLLDAKRVRTARVREATASPPLHPHFRAARRKDCVEPMGVKPTTRMEAAFVVAKSVQSITRLLVEELNHASEIAGSAGAHVADHTAKRTNALVASRLCVLVEDLGARRARVQLLMLVEARDVNKHVVG